MNENIVHITYKDKEIYLVKTAHVSKNSIEDVKEAYETYKPDSICIELDSERYKNLENKNTWQDTDIFKIIKEKKVGYLLVNLILANFQKRMAKSLGSNTGGEMIEGIKLAKENNLELVLADRSIKTTFSRIWSKLGFIEKAKLLASIIVSIFENDEISEEELKSLKESDALEAALNEVSIEFPILKEVLVDERDKYLSDKIKKAKGHTIIAIIGAAHANGIVRNIENNYNIKDFEIIEKPSTASKLIKWLIPTFILFMVIYTLIVNKDMGITQIKSWVLWNGGLSALGALISGGHIITILVAFIMAPITSLSPLLTAGIFTGITESYIRKPKVKDFENMSNDSQTLKGFYSNKVLRILLVTFLSSIFSALATFISGLDIFKNFLSIL